LTAATRELAKKKLKHFLISVKGVIEKINAANGTHKDIKFLLKAMILFKKEDLITSKILDFDFESDSEVTYVYE
jgi:hypothetical protein